MKMAAHLRMVAKAADHAATMDRIRPGRMRKANPREPALAAMTLFAKALQLIATRIGSAASRGVSFSAAVNEAMPELNSFAQQHIDNKTQSTKDCTK